MEKHHDFNFLRFAYKIIGLVINKNLNGGYYKTNNIEEMVKTECLNRFAFCDANIPDIRNKDFFGYLEVFYKSNKEIAAEFVRYPTAESSNNTKFHVGDRITYNGETYFVDRIPPCGTYINAHPTSIDFTDAFGTDKRISIKKKNWDAIELKPYSKDEMKVFDKVVVRGDDGYWVCATFSHNTDDGKFVTDAAVANECLPFNEYTEYLIGQNIDYNGFFKILFF